MGGLLSRRPAVYDVEFVAGAEDDGTLSYLSGTHCLDMFGGVTLCCSLGDLETLRVDIDASLVPSCPSASWLLGLQSSPVPRIKGEFCQGDWATAHVAAPMQTEATPMAYICPLTRDQIACDRSLLVAQC